MTDEESKLFTRIPTELKELLDADDRTNKQAVIDALWAELGGRGTTEIERRLQNLKATRSKIEREIEDEKKTLQKKDRQISALEEKLEKRESKTKQYDRFLNDLLDALEADEIAAVTQDIIRARDEFNNFDSSASEALEDAKELAVEQERGLKNTHFMEVKRAKRLMRRGEDHVLTEDDL